MRGQPGLRYLTSKVVEREECLNSNHVVLNFHRATSVVLAGFLQVTARTCETNCLAASPKATSDLPGSPKITENSYRLPLGVG